MHSCIGCIYLTFLHFLYFLCVFKRLHSYIRCFCVTVVQYVFSNMSVEYLSKSMHTHIALWVKSGNRGNLKCWKVNDNFAFIFHRKTIISFLSDAKLRNVYDWFLGLIIYVKYLKSYLQKHEGGVCEVWNFVCWPISSCQEKKKIALFTEPAFIGQIFAKNFFSIFRNKTNMMWWWSSYFLLRSQDVPHVNMSEKLLWNNIYQFLENFKLRH